MQVSREVTRKYTDSFPLSFRLYIYDRHCQCCYYTSPSPIPSSSTSSTSGPHARKEPGPSTLPGVLPPIPTPLISDSLGEDGTAPLEGEPVVKSGRLAFDEEAKLVYGVVFSLRNMIKKLSAR